MENPRRRRSGRAPGLIADETGGSAFVAILVVIGLALGGKVALDRVRGSVEGKLSEQASSVASIGTEGARVASTSGAAGLAAPPSAVPTSLGGDRAETRDDAAAREFITPTDALPFTAGWFGNALGASYLMNYFFGYLEDRDEVEFVPTAREG